MCYSFLINELKASPQICRDAILHVVVGGNNGEIRGTYGHPLLTPHVASWTSPSFAIKVSYIVREYREQIRMKGWSKLKKTDLVNWILNNME